MKRKSIIQKAAWTVWLGILLGMGACQRQAAMPPSESVPHIRIERRSGAEDKLQSRATTGVATEEELGVAFYPDAKIESSTLLRDARGITAAVLLSTRDRYTDVRQFYLERYGATAQLTTWDDPHKRHFALNWRTASGVFFVEIQQEAKNKRTLIHLVRLTGQARAPSRPHVSSQQATQP